MIAFIESLPDPTVLSVVAQLRELQPPPGICKALGGLSVKTLVDSKFGHVQFILTSVHQKLLCIQMPLHSHSFP